MGSLRWSFGKLEGGVSSLPSAAPQSATVVRSETTDAFCESKIFPGQNLMWLEEGNCVLKNVSCGPNLSVVESPQEQAELWFPVLFVCVLG